jgi:hypothetical protein
MRAPVGLATVLLTALLVAPHVAGTGPLDLLHVGVEQAVLALGLG